MLASFCSLKKKIFAVTTPTVHTSINQEERRRDRLPAHALTFSHWWHQSASHKWLTLHRSLIFADHGVKVTEEYINRNMMLL